jgi:hypothetical protein
MRVRARVVVAALAAAVTGSARLEAQQYSPLHAGGWIISGGGSIGLMHNDGVEGDVTHVSLQPTGLVFVTSRFAIGASVPLSYVDFGNSSGHAYEFGLGPTARYYFAADTSHWLPFLSASVQPQWQNVHQRIVVNTFPAGTVTESTVDFENRIVTADGSLGLTRLVAQHVGVTGELYYTHSSIHAGEGSGGSRSTYDVGARFGLTVFVH